MPTTMASLATDTPLAAAAGGVSIAPQVELGIQAAMVFFLWFFACLAVLKAADVLTSPRKLEDFTTCARSSGRDCPPGAYPTGRARQATGQGASAQARDPSPHAAEPRALSRPRIAKQHRSEGDLSRFCLEVPGKTRLQRRGSGSFCTAPGPGDAAGDAAEGSSRRRRASSNGSPERAASAGSPERTASKGSPTAPPQSPSGRLSSGTRFLARSWSAECTWANFLTSSECWRIEEEGYAAGVEAKEIPAAVREDALLDKKRGSRRCSLRSQSEKLEELHDDLSEARWSNFAQCHYPRHFAAAEEKSVARRQLFRPLCQ